MKRLLAFLVCTLLCGTQALAANEDRRAALASINTLRASRDLPPLRYSANLEKAALMHAEDMRRKGFFSHTGSDGSNVGKRLKYAGYNWCNAAENIAKGQRSLAEVMTGWEESRGHRKNMLHRKVTEFALARSKGNLWVMVLARPGC